MDFGSSIHTSTRLGSKSDISFPFGEYFWGKKSIGDGNNDHALNTYYHRRIMMYVSPLKLHAVGQQPL